MSEETTVWLVLQVHGNDTFNIIGVFDEEAKAVAACIQPNYCVGPLQMNQAVHETVQWPGAYYPAEEV